MNRHNTVDPVSELFERFSISLKRKELSLILIVGVVGCIGTMSVFKRSFIRPVSAVKNLSTINIMEEATNVTPSLQFNEPYLEITGRQSMRQSLNFSIANYDPKVTYEIDFGDGHLYRAGSPTLSHTYSSEGEFDVKLLIHYNDQVNAIYETSLRILSEQTSLISSL